MSKSTIKPADIILDILLTFNRPVQEQELVCELGNRFGIKHDDMLNVAENLRNGLRDLVKHGFLQQTTPGWYVLLPLDPKYNPLDEKHSVKNYLTMCDAYLEACSNNKNLWIPIPTTSKSLLAGKSAKSTVKQTRAKKSPHFANNMNLPNYKAPPAAKVRQIKNKIQKKKKSLMKANKKQGGPTSEK